MNLHLYKVLKLDDIGNSDDLEKTQVMTEKDLRAEFYFALAHMPQQMFDDYKQDPDYSSEDWEHPESNLKIGTIIDMMSDICNYKSGTGYYILETDVDVQLDRKMIDRWLDILNYWADDIQDLGERYDDKHKMYVKYDKMISDIYGLTKGE